MKIRGLSALNKDLINKIKKELQYLFILLISLIIILKIVLYKEDLFTITKLLLSVFWVLLIPGFFLIYIWHNKLDFLERTIISVPVSSALIGITSYNLALVNIDIKYHIFSLPIIFLILSLIIISKKR